MQRTKAVVLRKDLLRYANDVVEAACGSLVLVRRAIKCTQLYIGEVAGRIEDLPSRQRVRS